MVAATIAIRRTKLELLQKKFGQPKRTVELIGGGFKPSSQRNQNKSKVGHLEASP